MASILTYTNNDNWLADYCNAYLDWGSQTRISKKLGEVSIRNQLLFNQFPCSPLQTSEIFGQKVEAARGAIARLLHVPDDGMVLFTSGAVHGLELLCKTLVKGKNQLLYTTDQEFPVAINLVHQYFDHIRTDRFDDLPDIYRLLEGHDKKCSFFFSHVSYSLGSVLRLKEVIEIIRAKFPFAVIIVDSSQAVGNLRINMTELDVDAIVFNTNKWLLGPYCGVMIIKNRQLLIKTLPFVHSYFAIKNFCGHEKMSSSGLNLCNVASIADNLEMVSAALSAKDFEQRKIHLKSFFFRQMESEIGINLAAASSFVSPSGILSFSINGLTIDDAKALWHSALKNGYFFHLFENYQHPYTKENYPLFRISIHSFNTEDDLSTMTEFFKAHIRSGSPCEFVGEDRYH